MLEEGTARAKAPKQECSWCVFGEYCGWNGVRKRRMDRKRDLRGSGARSHWTIVRPLVLVYVGWDPFGRM